LQHPTKWLKHKKSYILSSRKKPKHYSINIATLTISYIEFPFNSLIKFAVKNGMAGGIEVENMVKI